LNVNNRSLTCVQ